jgi:hypothetical protein
MAVTVTPPPMSLGPCFGTAAFVTYGVRDIGGGVPVTSDRLGSACRPTVLEMGDPARSASLFTHYSAGGGLRWP